MNATPEHDFVVVAHWYAQVHISWGQDSQTPLNPWSVHLRTAPITTTTIHRASEVYRCLNLSLGHGWLSLWWAAASNESTARNKELELTEARWCVTALKLRTPKSISFRVAPTTGVQRSREPFCRERTKQIDAEMRMLWPWMRRQLRLPEFLTTFLFPVCVSHEVQLHFPSLCGVSSAPRYRQRQLKHSSFLQPKPYLSNSTKANRQHIENWGVIKMKTRKARTQQGTGCQERGILCRVGIIPLKSRGSLTGLCSVAHVWSFVCPAPSLMLVSSFSFSHSKHSLNPFIEV